MLKTTAKTFSRIPLSRLPLFAVQPDGPVTEAIDRTYCLLDLAQEMAEQAALAENSQQLCHVIVYLIDMAKATVDACSEGILASVEVSHE